MFKLRQDVYHAQTRHALLNNSLTFKVGDVIIPVGANTGAVTNDTTALLASPYVLGVITGFSKLNLEVISQGQDPLNTPNQLTTAADNTTVAQYQAVYVPITTEMEFAATLSAAAGTTTGSDTAFQWFDFTDARTLDETSVTAIGATPLAVLSYGVDPEDTTSKTIICRFAKAVGYQP